MTHNIRILQHNMNAQILVAEQLMEYCAKEKIDIILAQDPPCAGNKIPFFESCKIIATAEPGAAIIVLNADLKIITLSKFCNKYVAAANVSWGDSRETIQLVSAYFKFSLPTIEFVADLGKILQNDKPTLIGVDSNGRSKL